MKLTIEERILLFQLLPIQHDYKTLKELIDLRNKVKFTEEETRKFDIYSSHPTEVHCQVCDVTFANDGGIIPSALDGKYSCPKCGGEQTEIVKEDRKRSQITYNKEVSNGHLVDIKPKPHAKQAISKTLESMNKTQTLTEQYLTLYEKFIL
jgi:hypothetical protein